MVKKLYPIWYPSFKVSFTIKFNKFPSLAPPVTNIITFTTGEKCCHYGTRIPAVYCSRFEDDDDGKSYIRFLFISALNGNGNRFIPYTPKGQDAIALGKQYDITIQQSHMRGRYYRYEVFVSGKRIINEVNGSAKRFNNVKLYTSDPWYPAFTSDLGTISNLKIENHE